jgi:hypothetical protein
VAGLAYEPIGERPGDTSSTIIDGTGFDTNGGKISIVRGGVISRAAIAAIIGDALADENTEAVPDAGESPAAESVAPGAPMPDAPVPDAPGSDAPGSDLPGSDLPGSDQGATDRP